MKKLFFAGLSLFLIKGICFAVQREATFRVWKTTAIDGSNYQDVMLTSSSILVHSIVISSPTVNQGGNSFIAMYQSSMANIQLNCTNCLETSTRIFNSLDQGSAINSQGGTYDLRFSTITYFNKQGGARVNILWDWYIPDGSGIQRSVHLND